MCELIVDCNFIREDVHSINLFFGLVFVEHCRWSNKLSQQ